MDLRDILLTLHIAGVATWFGANIVQAVAPPLLAKQGSQASAGWYRVTGGLARRLYMPASILILGTGIWMVLINDAYSFGSTFVTFGFAAIVIGALLGIFVFEPGAERAAQAIESGDQGTIRSASGRLAAFGTVDTLILLVTIAAMILRLGA